jgi:hypothetical protein
MDVQAGRVFRRFKEVNRAHYRLTRRRCKRDRRYPEQFQGHRSLRRVRVAREDTVESRATTSPRLYRHLPNRVSTTIPAPAFSARKSRKSHKPHKLAATVRGWEAGNHLPCIETICRTDRPLPCRELGRIQDQNRSPGCRSTRCPHLLNLIRTGSPQAVECR